VTAPCSAGSLRSLVELVDELNPASILLFTGGASYQASGAAALISAATKGRPTAVISGVSANPDLEDVDRAIESYREFSPALVIAIGGGSVIDLAKTVRAVAPHSTTALPYALGERTAGPSDAPLVAIPTTAGTGSEATHFAVIYVDGKKHSIADPSMRPEHVILDPELTYSVPPQVTAATGLDALSQAIESFWSVKSTPTSRDAAERAIGLALDHLEGAVNRPDPVSRAAMCNAAHLAGRAIDESFTTAPHALSYVLTSQFGTPHGHAVALTLGAVLEYNASVTDASCGDPRGVDHVRRVMDRIVAMFGASDAAGARTAFENLVHHVGLSNTLAGLDAPPDQIRAMLAEGVNLQRLANNPRTFTQASLAEMLATVE
jgi:alcohol dehydrogenase class IV